MSHDSNPHSTLFPGETVFHILWYYNNNNSLDQISPNFLAEGEPGALLGVSISSAQRTSLFYLSLPINNTKKINISNTTTLSSGFKLPILSTTCSSYPPHSSHTPYITHLLHLSGSHLPYLLFSTLIRHIYQIYSEGNWWLGLGDHYMTQMTLLRRKHILYAWQIIKMERIFFIMRLNKLFPNRSLLAIAIWSELYVSIGRLSSSIHISLSNSSIFPFSLLLVYNKMTNSTYISLVGSYRIMKDMVIKPIVNNLTYLKRNFISQLPEWNPAYSFNN